MTENDGGGGDAGVNGMAGEAVTVRPPLRFIGWSRVKAVRVVGGPAPSPVTNGAGSPPDRTLPAR